MGIIPGPEKYNLLLLLQTFQLCVATNTAHNTSPLCRYYTRTSLLVTEVQYLVREKILNEDCKKQNLSPLPGETKCGFKMFFQTFA